MKKIDLELEKEAKKAWQWLVENNKIPPFIPINPDVVYKKEWKGFAEFLGWNDKETKGKKVIGKKS